MNRKLHDIEYVWYALASLAIVAGAVIPNDEVAVVGFAGLVPFHLYLYVKAEELGRGVRVFACCMLFLHFAAIALILTTTESVV